MGNAEREQTHREMIQLVARDIGNHLKPSEYIDEVYKRFGVETTGSSVCKSLGSFANRLRADEKHLKKIGRQLIDECYGDRDLARYILNHVRL